MDALILLKQNFLKSKTDEKTNDQKDDEQSDTTDMFELKIEESAAQRGNHLTKGLKILTPHQMLGRLPITLAQLKAGNNLERLKNGIRQLSYSFHCSKKLAKTIYNNLIKTI